MRRRHNGCLTGGIRRKMTTLLMVWSVVTLTIAAEACTSAMIDEANDIVTTNQALFESCIVDLSSDSNRSSSSPTSFLTTKYVDPTNAKLICASSNCVNALIVAMEKLPDCCSSSISSGKTINVPRLADAILHQCDLIDAQQLQLDLETAIAKLPDLKVQIQSQSSATSGSSAGVDVIIDVKRREEMQQQTSASVSNVATNTTATSAAMASHRSLFSQVLALLISVGLSVSLVLSL